VRPLLPRGPNSSRTREGHSWWSSCSVTAVEWPQGYLPAATRWSASPLHSRGLTISNSELNSLAVQDRREIHAGILAAELSRSCQDADSGRRTTPYKALMSKKRASCIENRRLLVLMNHKGSLPDRRLMPAFRS